MRVSRSLEFSGGRAGAGSRIGRVQIVTCLWVVSTFGTLVTATAATAHYQQDPFYIQGRFGKREDASAGFLTGSRYGRDGTTNSGSSKSDPKLLEVSPRVDRFFLGSRYGKRVLPNNENDNSPGSRQPSPRISALKRFEEALGYFDRVDRADRTVRTVNRQRDRKTSGKSIDANHPDNEDTSFEFSNQEKLDNIW
ncbi:uncharacterized protein RYa [Venturia canescens]|uniref:uncharacterized protein RYa n=1 Tax=Venturia canescens TaxID=32260 RepID=UPI001C9CFC60|nr:uncharacterized protein LOC122413757 [Venturia canescens]